MTHRRLPNTKPGPRLENQRGDEPTPACLGKPEPFDVLHEQTRGPGYEVAKREAEKMCGACPLQRVCWTKNADTDWVRALRKPHRPQPREGCGTPDAVNEHRRRNERLCRDCVAFETERRRANRNGRPSRFAAASEARREQLAQENAARLEELQRLDNMGGDIVDACELLGLSRDALAKWCTRHGHRDLYERIGSRGRKRVAA